MLAAAAFVASRFQLEDLLEMLSGHCRNQPCLGFVAIVPDAPHILQIRIQRQLPYSSQGHASESKMLQAKHQVIQWALQICTLA